MSQGSEHRSSLLRSYAEDEAEIFSTKPSRAGLVCGARPISVFIVGFVATVLLFSGQARAEVPDAVSYQGLLALGTGQLAEDGLYQLHFRIFDDPVLSNTMLFDQALDVEVRRGLYNVLLSSHDGQDLTAAIQGASQAFMEVEIVSGPNGAIGETLTPRQRIASVPYAMSAPTGLPAGGIILWDQNNGCDGAIGECPCGFTVAGEFAGIGVRGAGVPGTDVPTDPGESCPGSLLCNADASQYDDTLSEAELATHAHAINPVRNQRHIGPTLTGESDAYEVNNNGTNVNTPQGSLTSGEDSPHYHPFRTVLFCRKN